MPYPSIPQFQQQALPSMGWREALFGSPEKYAQMATASPMQQQFGQQALQYAGNRLFGNEFDFAPIEAQARKGFQTQTIPSIMQRFASNENLGSGGLNYALSGAGSDLEMQLAAMKQQYNLAQQPLLQNLFGMGMQPQSENILRPGTAGLMEKILMALIGGGSQMGAGALQGYYSNPARYANVGTAGSNVAGAAKTAGTVL